MGKNIVVCLDGTGNEVKARGASNIFKLVELLDLRDPDRQVVYYDPGVGTFAAPSAWTAVTRRLSRLGGLALGHGLRQNLGEAYTYLMNSWRPGDRVFVFGFSRGAYTARALCGMLYRVGLLRPGSENLVPYAVRVYARRPGRDSDLSLPEGWARIDRFAEALSVRPAPKSLAFPIDFLGLFDTVKATGFLGRDITWPYTNRLPNVRVARHAVAIDERRRPYREDLIPQPGPGERRRVSETWFAGAHSDVGGGFDEHPELGRISLRWMLEGAVAEGLLVREQRIGDRYPLAESDASGVVHPMGWIWAVTGHRRRPIPPGGRVHASVRTRISTEPEYARELPDGVVWDEECWPFRSGTAETPSTP
ncbi:Uncharacterized alpha/beta hydrolase domain [Nonomuraea jiangxiensis]|uniref:Uncharacterized alpha/beta hydrolase domain n=2 Tax=Nonomuraea jiangxiensis TaxID=633440 RepID=A0A1G9F356_9ACTN|nr:Uncharacterized alpha/beta hydrolase domain [Nonomuraea jiangxiensis]